MTIENPRDSLDLGAVEGLPTPIERARTSDSALVVVDMQTRLLPAIADREEIVVRVNRMIRAARLLDLPVRATEHCADAIGATDPILRVLLSDGEILPKRSFDALAEPSVATAFKALGRRSIAVCGAEAHVCVAQTALGLRAAGYRVFVLEDACGSRHEGDRVAGLARLRQAGCVPMTVEAMVFEWLGGADHPRFRDTLELIKES